MNDPMEYEIESEDHFDRIPDSILVSIFNKLDDIKALGRCCAVSKRFNNLVPEVEDVTVKVDCVISGEDAEIGGKGKGIWGSLFRVLFGSIVRPLQVLQNHLLGAKKLSSSSLFDDELSRHHSPGEVLKNFKHIRSLRIELPSGELGVESGVLLKWKAEFGATLESCIILGASNVLENSDFPKIAELESLPEVSNSNGSTIPEPFYTNGGLKLRVVWTISSLIAASARHFLLQQIVCEHPSLESLVLTDCDGQGMLCMGKRQLQDFREQPLVASASSNRTQVPALNMKLWYSPCLELSGGMKMEGATLVAIRPNDRPLAKKETDAFVSAAFDEPYRAAARVLAKGRTYLLEMNSF